jgi:hypothetical protein
MKKRLVNVNDNHKVLWEWEDIQQVLPLLATDLLRFYGPKKNKKAGVRAKGKIRTIIAKLRLMRKGLTKQRQDYDSEY